MSDLRRPFDSEHVPDEALAGYVDGTLTATERADVTAHLDGCERCRAQVALAESAAGALRSLPELDAPWGLGRQAIEEARKGARPARARRFAMGAGIAAAVVLVAGLAVAVLRGPQGTTPLVEGAATSGATSAAAGGDKFAPSAPSPEFVKSTQNYSAEDVSRLALDYSAQADKVARTPSGARPLASTNAPTGGLTGTSGTSGAGASGTSGTTETSGAETSGTSATFGTSNGSTSGSVPVSGPSPRGGVAGGTLAPVACIDTAAGYARSTVPVRVIDARFQEQPALIGIFLRGPAAGKPADLVVVWVASKDCEVLSYASHRITP